MPSFTIVTCDDWQGLFCDGRLLEENHSLDLRDTIERMSVDCRFEQADEQWMNEEGRFPAELSKVVLADE